MSTTTPLAPPAPAHVEPAPRVRDRVRRQRTVVVVGVLVLGVAVLLAWAGGGSSRGYLDPGSVEPDGSRALARVLAGQGVTVVPVRTAAEAVERSGPGTTLLITGTALLGDRVLRRVQQARPDALVLVEPDAGAVGLLVPGVSAGEPGPVEVRQPRCDDPTADRAGAALTGGGTYTDARGGATGCYPGQGDPSVLVVPARDGRPATTILGTGQPLTNDRLADEGDAALALGVLGAQPTLVWYRPSLTDPLLTEDESGDRLGDLVPGWVVPALAQLVVAALIAVAWRARRLGPVVTEPLPVVVRAAEATEGRARLYRRGRDRGHAADALRRRCRTQVAQACGLGPRAHPDAVVAAAAARTGRTAPHVAALLWGGAPADDAALVRLAGDLDTLVAEVRRP